MNSELDLLSKKIERLVLLIHELRQENRALRTHNADLLKRIVDAQQRVSVLLKKIPLTDSHQEPV